MTIVLVNLPNDTLHKNSGECPGAFLWTGRSNGSTFVKKCPNGITPNRLEEDGAQCCVGH